MTRDPYLTIPGTVYQRSDEQKTWPIDMTTYLPVNGTVGSVDSVTLKDSDGNDVTLTAGTPSGVQVLQPIPVGTLSKAGSPYTLEVFITPSGSSDVLMTKTVLICEA